MRSRLLKVTDENYFTNLANNLNNNPHHIHFLLHHEGVCGVIL